jgi:hypothetical protein
LVFFEDCVQEGHEVCGPLGVLLVENPPRNELLSYKGRSSGIQENMYGVEQRVLAQNCPQGFSSRAFLQIDCLATTASHRVVGGLGRPLGPGKNRKGCYSRSCFSQALTTRGNPYLIARSLGRLLSGSNYSPAILFQTASHS